MDVTYLLDIATEAARAVGPRLRKAFRSRPEVSTKRDFHDPVTEHDRPPRRPSARSSPPARPRA